MELEDHVLRLPGDSRLVEESLWKLQGGLHDSALQQRKNKQSNPRNWRGQPQDAWQRPTLCRRLEKDPVMLHLKVSWRSCPAERSGMGLWNNMQVMPFQSPARTA